MGICSFQGISQNSYILFFFFFNRRELHILRTQLNLVMLWELTWLPSCSSAGLCVAVQSNAQGLAGRGIKNCISPTHLQRHGRHWDTKHPFIFSVILQKLRGLRQWLKRRIKFTSTCWDERWRCLALRVQENPLFQLKRLKPSCFCTRLMETAREMTRESLPIKCLEAVILGMYPFVCLWLFPLQHCWTYCPPWMMFEMLTATGECKQLRDFPWDWPNTLLRCLGVSGGAQRLRARFRRVSCRYPHFAFCPGNLHNVRSWPKVPR